MISDMNKMDIIGRGLYLICNQGSHQKNCTVITILRQTRILHILLICLFASLMWLIILLFEIFRIRRKYIHLCYLVLRGPWQEKTLLYFWGDINDISGLHSFLISLNAVPHGPGWSWGAYTGIFSVAFQCLCCLCVKKIDYCQWKQLLNPYIFCYILIRRRQGEVQTPPANWSYLSWV